MKLTALAAKANKEYAQAQNSAVGVVNHLIMCGEHIAQAKVQSDGKWEDWVNANLEFKFPQASKYMRIAKHKAQVQHLVTHQGDMSINDIVAVIPKTSEACVEIEADAENMAYVGSKPTVQYESKDDWRTPGKYIESVVNVMGSIDLDPFSSHIANADIGALRYFDVTDNALTQDWESKDTRTVWMNPPYGRGMINKAVDKFLEQYDNGSFKEAIVLVNNATDTHWFYDMGVVADGICFTHGRIQFIAGDKLYSSNTRGQAFFYFGGDFTKFKAEFSKHGLVYKTEVS